MREAKRFPSGNDDTYPALRFQRLFQMEEQNIGRRWRMPNGMSMLDAEKALWKNKVLELWEAFSLDTYLTSEIAENHPEVAARFALASNIADAFILLNPDLRTVDFDRKHWHELRGFLHGVVSGFNTDDLQAWIDGTINYPLVSELQDYIREQFHAPESESVYPPQLRAQFNARAHEDNVYLDYEVHGLLWAPSEITVYRIFDTFEARRVFKADGMKP